VAQKANLSFKNRFFYISVTDEDSDFKYRIKLEFAKTHHQMSLEKSGCDPRLGKLPEIWGFPFDITATAKASDIKSHTERMRVALG